MAPEVQATSSLNENKETKIEEFPVHKADIFSFGIGFFLIFIFNKN